MIAHLQGVLVVKTVERVVLDVHGVGYQAVVPLSTYYALPDLQERVTLLTTMYVREDTMRLYGFATSEEQEMFELLIGVSSVGPRLALNMLSSLTAADLQQAIAQAETRRLQAIPGVGRKTAERVVLELQDKMAALALTASGQPSLMVTADEQVMRDVISALLNLGYRQQEAERAVRTARAKGMFLRTIYLRHVMRNALIPVVTMIGILTGELLGGAVLMGHSQSGWYPLAAALIDPAVTKGLVLVEPGACPGTYTAEQIATLAKVPILVVFGDHRDVPTGLPSLPTWQERFEACQALIGRVRSAGGRAEMLNPPERGIRGNSHMIMQDKNSLQIADLILQWIEERVAKRRGGK